MVEDVATYILRYWRKIVDTQAFALRNPQAIKEAVVSIQSPTSSNTATLLLLAAEATGVRLGQELRQSLTDAAHLSVERA
jgi:hypothetical protein